jgi:hypothetical protein
VLKVPKVPRSPNQIVRSHQKTRDTQLLCAGGWMLENISVPASSDIRSAQARTDLCNEQQELDLSPSSCERFCHSEHPF